MNIATEREKLIAIKILNETLELLEQYDKNQVIKILHDKQKRIIKTL